MVDWWIIAEQAARPLMERLGPAARLRVFLALIAILLLGVLAVWVIRMTGRLTRWYATGSAYVPRPGRKPIDVDDWAKGGTQNEE
jgi:hypothetical protein